MVEYETYVNYLNIGAGIGIVLAFSAIVYQFLKGRRIRKVDDTLDKLELERGRLESAVTKLEETCRVMETGAGRPKAQYDSNIFRLYTQPSNTILYII